MNHDVIIIGAGPAGSAAAINLAKNGISVLLLDKYQFPREKVCGDGLIPDAIHNLQQIGVWDDVSEQARLLHEVALYSPNDNHVLLTQDCYTLKRCDLDDILVKRAISCGASFHQATVSSVKNTDIGVRITTKTGETYRGKVALVATGVGMSLLQQTPELICQKQPNAVAIRGYLKSSYDYDKLLVSFHASLRKGYGWIFPMTDGLYNIGCGFLSRGRKQPDLKKCLQTFMETFPVAKQLQDEGEWVSEPIAAALRTGLSDQPCVSGNIMALGETIHTTFPTTGEGVGKALESGIRAAQVVTATLEDKACLNDYNGCIKAMKPSYLGYALAEKWLRWFWVVNMMVFVANKSSYTREKMCDLFAEKVDMARLFSKKNVVKLVFRHVSLKLRRT